MWIGRLGTAIFNITSGDGGSSSLLLPTDGELPVLREEIVQIRTLDSYIEVFKNEIGVIKMDVEKNELEVIRGALTCLERSKYPRIFFESDKTYGEVFEFLNSKGYRVIPIQSYANMYLAEVVM